MADFFIPTEIIAAFFAGAGVIYGFALTYRRFYIDVISSKVFVTLLGISCSAYFIHLFISSYSERLIEKLNGYPAAKEIANKQWESFSKFMMYATLFLTCCWAAYLILEWLIRALESYKKSNSE